MMNAYKTTVAILVGILVTFSGCSYNGFFDKETSLSKEVFEILSSDSLYFKHNSYNFENISNDSFTSEKFKSYIKSIDEYGAFFSKQEYQAYNSTMSSSYMGIGMILYQEKNNNAFFCIPVNDKLRKMGISQYDQLVSVNGEPVTGKNLYIVSSLIRGKQNTYVNIKIKKASGITLSLKIKRVAQHYKTVNHIRKKGMNVLKIIEFKKETPDELLSILLTLKKDEPIIIDVRDNSGGDLFSAIESADLFLAQGTYISSIKTIKSKDDYYALNQDYIKGQKVFLVQNKNTASASEVFISALTENHRAVSIGSKSFGKGVAQKIVPLSDGSAILFSYAELITPSGNSYNKKGLLPTSDLTLNSIIKENFN